MEFWLVEMDAANDKLLDPSATGRSDYLESVDFVSLTFTLPPGGPIIQGQKLYQLNEAMPQFSLAYINRQKDKMVFCKTDSCGSQLFTYCSD